MEDGFDIYLPPRMHPVTRYKIPTTRKYVKKAVFGEGGKAVVCGSDHGSAYIFTPEDVKPIQILKHGSNTELVQVVEVREFY